MSLVFWKSACLVISIFDGRVIRDPSVFCFKRILIMIEMTIQRLMPSGDVIITCNGMTGRYINVSKSQAEQMFRHEFGLEHRRIVKHYPKDRLQPHRVSDRITSGGSHV